MVILVVDALGWTLASGASGFAPSLGHRRRIETVLGFSSGALPTLFTGRSAREHGRFLMYARARGGDTPFRGFGWTRLLPARARRSWRLGRALTRAVARRGVRGYFDLYEVPRDLLPEFDLPERDDIFAPRGLPVDSLWDAFERAGLSWRGWNWRTPEADNLGEVERSVAAGAHDVLVCYTADLDALLHHQGSRGPAVAERLTRYDAFLARLEAVARGRGDTLRLYLVSDHGMVDVRRTVDAMGCLARLPWRWPGHYLPFFDSTFARFWWRDPAARAPVREALDGLGAGRWLGPAELEAAGVADPEHRWGDDLFLCDPGVLVVPSFMGRQAVAAMHGYDPSHPDMAALLWSNRPIPEAVRRLADVRGFLEAEAASLRAEAA
jgi:hypothetical protein